MKIIKWLLWLVLFLVIVAVGGAIFLVTKVDPNDLKPQISRQVETLTGRQLYLGGDLAWQFYPWVGVTVNDFALSNRAGFTPDNMLEAAQVDVQIKLIPLLSKQLEIGKVKLLKPKISLSVNAEGATNWDDLAGNGESGPADAPEQEAGAMLGGLVVQGVDISEGHISWNDQSAGQQYLLSDFNLSTGTIEPGAAVDFQLSSSVDGTDLPSPARVEIAASVLLSEAMDALKVTGLSTQLGTQQQSADISLDSLDYSLTNGLLVVSAMQGEASDEAMGLNAEFALASLGFDTNSGQLDANTLTATASMEDLKADVSLNQLGYALETQVANIDRLSYSGSYQAYPFSGEASSLSFDVAANRLALGTQSASSEYNGVPANLRAEQIQLDLNQETLQAPVLVVELGEARVETGIQASQLFGDIQASGKLATNAFNPRLLIESLDLDLLPELPEQAMQSLSFQTGFSGGLSAVAVEGMRVRLDKSTLTGDFSMTGFESPVYRFDLQLDQVNVDDYLSEEQQAAAEESGPAAAVVLPFAELKGLDVKGQLAIGELRVLDLLSNDVLVKVDAAADRIEVSPLNALVYGGEVQNSLVYDIAGEVPAVEINSELISLDLGPFLRALQITDRFDGLGSVSAAISSRGLELDDAVANLNGVIDISLKDGAISGVDIQKSLIKAESTINALAGKELGLGAELGDKTEFSEFTGNIRITDGVMDVRDINLKAPAIRVQGGGKVDLVNEQLDMKLDVSVVGSFEGQGGASADKLKGQTIPMKITGALADPSILPDFSKILQGELEKKLSEKYLGGEELSGESFDDALKSKLNEKLAEKVGGGAAATATVPAGEASTPAPPTAPNADIFGSSDSTAQPQSAPKKGNEDIFGEPEKSASPEPAPEPEPEPKSMEDQLKDELKGKLLKGLFGN